MWSDSILIDQLEIYVERKQYAQSYSHLTLVFRALLNHEQELESDQMRRLLKAAHAVVLGLSTTPKPADEPLPLDEKIYLHIKKLFERLTIVAKRNPAFAVEFNEILQAFYLDQGDVYRALAKEASHQPEKGYLDARQKYSTALAAYHKAWRMPVAAHQARAAMRISQTIAETRYLIIREDYRPTYDPHESVRQLTEYGMYQEREHYDDAFMDFYQQVMTTASKQLNLNDDATQYRALIEIVLPFLDKLENDGKIQEGIAIAGILYKHCKATEDEYARHLLGRYTHLTNVGQGTEPAVRPTLLLPVSRWEIEVARLRALRGRFDDIPTTTYRATQKQYTQEIIAFLSDKAHRIAQLFKQVPCRYQLVGLGSMAREEMNRFSDADIGLLLEESEALSSDPDSPDKLVEVEKFFKKWFDLFTLELEALGETEGGLFIDEVSRLSLKKIRQGYANTPEGILREFSPQNLLTDRELFNQPGFYAWYRGIIPLYGHGPRGMSVSLTKPYHGLLWQALRDGEKHRAIAERYLTTHLQLFAHQELTVEINLKERFIRPLTYLYSDLGLYYGIEAYDLEGIVEELKRNDIDPAFLQVFQTHHQFIHDLRCRAHRFYGEEHDIVSLVEGAERTEGDAIYRVDPADRKRLEGTHGFLQSLARQIPRLLAQKTAKPFNPISEDFRCLLLADFNSALIEVQKEFVHQIESPTDIQVIAYNELRLHLEELEKRFITLQKIPLWTGSEKLAYQTLFKDLERFRENLLFQYEAEPRKKYWVEIPENKRAEGLDLSHRMIQWIQADQTKLAPLMASDLSNQHTEIIQAYVEFLVQQRSNPQTYNEYYGLLPFYWQPQFTASLPHEEYARLRPLLDCHPLPDGTRPSVMRERTQFEEGLKALFISAVPAPRTTEPVQNPRDETSEITLSYATFTERQKVSGRLKPEVAAQLQDIPTRLTAERPRGAEDDRSHNHLVIPIMINGQGYHVKVCPEFPAFEIAVSSLYQLMIGYGAPPSVLACITIAGKDYPLLISKTVLGERLDQHFKRNPNPPIDKHRFSQLVLMCILLAQEDGKPPNYIYDPLLRMIISVDNDHAFVQPVLERMIGRDQILIKTILFCFDQMNIPLTQESIEEFLTLDPAYILDHWLKGLHTYANQAKSLFQAVDVRTWENTPIPKPTENRYYQNSIVDFQLPPRLVSRLYQQMIMMQQLLKQNSQITPYELLSLLDPRIRNYYGRLLALPESVPARFEHIARELYGPVLQSTQYLTIVRSVSSRILPSTGSYTIPQAQRELALVEQQYNLVHWMKARLEGGENPQILEGLFPYFQVQIINQLDWKKIPPAYQKMILVLLTDPEISTVTRKLIFRGCDALTSGVLEKILAKKTYLQILVIEDCPSLQHAILPDLPQLQRLSIQGCGQFSGIRSSQKTKLVSLDRLARLTIEDCPRLIFMAINLNYPIDECYLVEFGIRQYQMQRYDLAERFLKITLEKWPASKPHEFRYVEAWYYRGLTALYLGQREAALKYFTRMMQGNILLLGSCLKEGEPHPRLAEQLERLWTENTPFYGSMVNMKVYLFPHFKTVLTAFARPAPFPALFGAAIAPLSEAAIESLAERIAIPESIQNPNDIGNLFSTLRLQTTSTQWHQLFKLPSVRGRFPTLSPPTQNRLKQLMQMEQCLPKDSDGNFLFRIDCVNVLKVMCFGFYATHTWTDDKNGQTKPVVLEASRDLCISGLEEATRFTTQYEIRTPLGGHSTICFKEIKWGLQFRFYFRWAQEQTRYILGADRNYDDAVLFFQGEKSLRWSLHIWNDNIARHYDILRAILDNPSKPHILITYNDNTNEEKAEIEAFKQKAHIQHHIQVPYGGSVSPQELCRALTGIANGRFVEFSPKDAPKYTPVNPKPRPGF